MTIKPAESTMVIRSPGMVTDGLVVSREAFIELDTADMRSDFVKFFQHYFEAGMIRVRVAEVKDPTQVNCVKVSPLEFVEMVFDKEHLVGKPIIWAEWPNKEKP